MTAIVHLQGYLGKDAETNTVNDQQVMNLTLATSDKGKDGEKKTIWWRLSKWGVSEKLLDYLTKGTALSVVAQLKPPSTYMDNSGGKTSSHEFVYTTSCSR